MPCNTFTASEHYADGVKTAQDWMRLREVPESPYASNRRDGYALLTVARAKDNRHYMPARAYLLGFARTLRA